MLDYTHKNTQFIIFTHNKWKIFIDFRKLNILFIEFINYLMYTP